MIDPEIFETKFQILLERYAQQFSKPTIDAYYEFLSDRMTTEEFAVAFEKLFASGDAFPSPQSIVDAGKGQDLMSKLQAIALQGALKREMRSLQIPPIPIPFGMSYEEYKVWKESDRHE